MILIEHVDMVEEKINVHFFLYNDPLQLLPNYPIK